MPKIMLTRCQVDILFHVENFLNMILPRDIVKKKLHTSENKKKNNHILLLFPVHID